MNNLAYIAAGATIREGCSYTRRCLWLKAITACNKDNRLAIQQQRNKFFGPFFIFKENHSSEDLRDWNATDRQSKSDVESPRFTDPFFSLNEYRSSEDPRDRNATSRQSKNEASIHYRLRAKINDVKNCVGRTREAFKAVQENILMIEVPPESLYQEWLGIEKVRRIFFEG